MEEIGLRLSEAARMLGKLPYNLEYAHRAGAPEPPRVFGQRCYGVADLERMRQFFTEREERRRRKKLKAMV